MGNEITIALKANDAQLRAVSTRVQASMKKLQGSFQRVANAARLIRVGSLLAIGGLVKLAGEQEAAETKLASVLRATGEAAGFSLEELKKFASGLQEVTTFGDEAILSAQAVLATFKEIKGDNFKAATEAALDMSIVLDSDLKGAMIQLGKALNDPIKGISALSKAGISFTEQQKLQIKTLQESGDIAGAQKIILEELAGEMGGAARDAAKTFFGQLKQMVNVLGDAGEVIGKVFVPSIKSFAKWVKSTALVVAEWARNNKEAILSLVKWGGRIGLAVLAINVMIKALALLNLRLLAVVASKIAVLAMSGPAGWAKLAVGAGLIAGAAVVAKLQWDKFKTSVDDAKEAIKKANEEKEKGELQQKKQIKDTGKVAVESSGLPSDFRIPNILEANKAIAAKTKEGVDVEKKSLTVQEKQQATLESIEQKIGGPATFAF